MAALGYFPIGFSLQYVTMLSFRYRQVGIVASVPEEYTVVFISKASKNLYSWKWAGGLLHS